MVEGVFDGHERLLPFLLGVELALPHGHHMPPHLRQPMLHLDIPLFVAFYLAAPKLDVGLRQAILVAIRMAMPEAAIHKDASAVLAEHDVGRARQPAIVDTVTETAGEEIPPHHHLWFRILRVNRSHDLAPLFRRQSIHIRKSNTFIRNDKINGYFFRHQTSQKASPPHLLYIKGAESSYPYRREGDVSSLWQLPK